MHQIQGKCDNGIDDDIFDEYYVYEDDVCSQLFFYAHMHPFIHLSILIYLHNHRILIYISSSTPPPTVPSTGAVQAEAVSIPEASAASDTTSTTANVTTNTAEGAGD